jgi:hypothetical protein
MHGMLSSVIILAAFALVAGVGGYIALWLYRAAPGAWPSRPGLVGGAGDLEEVAAPGGEPGDPAGPDGPEATDMPEEEDTPEEPEDAGADEAAAEFEPPGETGTAGARLYLLGEPRLPRR